MWGEMKEKKLHYLLCILCLMLMTACGKEIDRVVVPINRTAENLHADTENIEISELEIIPDTEVHFKDSKVVVEKKF